MYFDFASMQELFLTIHEIIGSALLNLIVWFLKTETFLTELFLCFCIHNHDELAEVL